MSDPRLAPLDAEHPENRGVLAFLRQAEPARAPIARPSSVPDPYHGAGCHPDVVEQLWDGLGRALPRTARALVFGAPALVHPRAGIVLAVGLGTSYALRLPASAWSEPDALRLASVHSFRSAAVSLDLAPWGPAWRFGSYLAPEREWLGRAADELDA